MENRHEKKFPKPIETALHLLEKARDFTKHAEALYQNSLPIPAINEFRNVAYHLIRYIRNPSAEEMENVLRHSKKAYLDASEAYAVALLEHVMLFKDSFRGYSDIVSRHLAAGIERKRAAVHHLERAIRSLRDGSEEARFGRAAQLQSNFPLVEEYLDDIQAAENEISDEIRREKNSFRLKVLGIIVLPIILWILTCLFKSFFKGC